ncbi:DUF1203 domain-containing protein [Micromonospora sp. DR5-3]|uniref:DUF1203 domain-containing protein n=1 Tax=unclassified Micromonospora TaxID=2617518 RepID=UPI0011D57939|nr:MULTISPECIES: DUF1203 domain-containing protein [unclassified Micromonospora]MCW3815150.1 DUF1203 domain-containing protein [Micromonospora sp. DR5-3]TYC10680.1 DUF1203 domain-containing protein [Micromonospora sp. MP36]
MTTGIRYLIEPMPGEALAEVRRTGRDASGQPPERRTAEGGEPLRCCLRDATAGEPLLLFGYAPPLPAGPYREVGPIFAHDADCPGPDHGTGYPADWRGRPQVLRAYDRRGRIVGGRHHDGGDPERVIAELLADPAVDRLHSRNVVYGCFMFVVARP